MDMIHYYIKRKQQTVCGKARNKEDLLLHRGAQFAAQVYGHIWIKQGEACADCVKAIQAMKDWQPIK